MPEALAKLLTIEEVADLLGVPMKTIYAWRQRGLGPRGIRVGRYLKFRPIDVAQWIDDKAKAAR